jgi:integrase
MSVHLLKKTKNLRQVQKQLGHASPTTTANMYFDISYEDMQEGVNGLYDTAQ